MNPFKTLLLLLCSLSVKAQPTNNFQLVDEFKIKRMPVKVFFSDPLKILLLAYPDFDAKTGKEKNDLLSQYLNNNALYVFQTTEKNGASKCYVLKGNRNKVRTAHFYDLLIINKSLADLGSEVDNFKPAEKTIDQLGVSGIFFENMILFQNADGKKALGKLINIWGYFSMIQPYATVKTVITDIIKQDINNTIPEDIIAKPEVTIQPLFDYENCGLKHVKGRTCIITVYQYDSTGKVINAYPRTEQDADLYHASASSDDIVSATAFPFFSAADTIKEVAKNIFTVHSTQKYLNHYLQNVKVFKNEQTGNVERVEGTLLIHGYSAGGQSLFYEFYVAEFSQSGSCFLPKTITFYSTADDAYKHNQPLIITNISYEMKE